MANKKINQLDVRTSPSLTDLLAIADPSSGYAYKITGTSLQSLLDVTNRVPYIGASSNVNLGTFNITAANIIRNGGLSTQFLKADGSIDSTTYMNRAVYDTDADGIVDSAATMQTIGRNSTGSTLYKGTIVYISGSTGNRPNFVKAQANSEATSAGTFGVVISDIANNSDGYVATIGTLSNLDTRTTATNPFTSVTLADGDTIYLDPNTAGYVTNVKPSAPNHLVYVGKVVRTSPTNGTIVYRIQNGYELSEIHDVAISSVANNEVLTYESSTSLWKNKSISTILGYTPQAAITLTTTGSSGAATFVSNTLNIPTVTLASLGGASDSLVMHLAGTETATGFKTFSIGLQTTTGDNFMNTSSGNLLVGYAATPGTNTYKLNVNGTTSLGGKLTLQSGTIQKYLYTDTSSGLQSFSVGTGYELFGTLHSAGGFSTYLTTSGFASGWNIIVGNSTYKSLDIQFNKVQSNVDLQAIAGISNITGNGSMSTYYSSPYEGFRPNTTNGWGFGIFNSANSVMMAVKNTGQFVLSGYTSTSVFTGTVAGLLGFDSSGNIITTSASGGISGSGTAGQVTYWSGTSAVTGSSNMTWNNTNGTLNITSIALNAATQYVGLNITSIGTTRMYFTSTATGSNWNTGISINSGSTPKWTIAGYGSTFDFTFYNEATASAALFIKGTTNNLLLNSTTDAGYRLDVNGTGATAGALRVTGGNSLFNGNISLTVNQNSTTSITLTNTTSGTGAGTDFIAVSDSGSGSVQFGKYSSLKTAYKIVSSKDCYFYNNVTAGDISFLNDFTSGQIKFAAGGASTAHLTIKSNGRINMSALPTSATGLSAGDLWNNSGVINIV